MLSPGARSAYFSSLLARPLARNPSEATVGPLANVTLGGVSVAASHADVGIRPQAVLAHDRELGRLVVGGAAAFFDSSASEIGCGCGAGVEHQNFSSKIFSDRASLSFLKFQVTMADLKTE